MIRYLLTLIAAIYVSGSVYATGGQRVSAQKVVDVYMDVTRNDCYDTVDNVVELANRYGANQVRLNVVNSRRSDVVRFQQNVRVRANRGTRVVIVNNPGARRFASFGQRVLFRVGQAVLFNRVFGNGFSFGERLAAQAVLARTFGF